MKKLLLKQFLLASIALVALTLSVKAEDIKVALIGNSITEGAGTITFATQLDGMLGEGWLVGNFGVSGRTLLKNGDYPIWNETRFTQALDTLPDKVIIMLGTNDSKYYNWAYKAEFLDDYLSLIDTLQGLSSSPEIWVCYPPKAFNHNWDIDDSVIVNEIIPLIDSVVAKRSVKLIDFHSITEDKEYMSNDGIHPTSSGNNFFAEVLFEVLVDSSHFTVKDKNVLCKQTITTESASNSTESNLIDGNFANLWQTSGLPASAVIDIGEEKTVDYFQLALSTDMNKGYQYTIEGSLNGTDWTMLADNSAREDTVSIMSTDSIGATNVRYIRLSITSFSNSSSTSVNICEFKAFEYTGFEHAPLFALKRVSKTTASTYIKRDHPGDAISYFGSTINPGNFNMTNFSTSKSTLINYNAMGTVGVTNYLFAVNYYNGIKVISDTSEYTFYDDVQSGIDNNVELNGIQVFPNPFSNEISFINPVAGSEISVRIYSITGELVITLKGKEDIVVWDGKDLNSNEVPSGIYICNISSSDNVVLKNIAISKR